MENSMPAQQNYLQQFRQEVKKLARRLYSDGKRMTDLELMHSVVVLGSIWSNTDFFNKRTNWARIAGEKLPWDVDFQTAGFCNMKVDAYCDNAMKLERRIADLRISVIGQSVDYESAKQSAIRLEARTDSMASYLKALKINPEE